MLEKTSKLFEKEKVDVLVNCGGSSMRDCFEDISHFDMITQMMHTNCTSHIAVTKSALPGMIKRSKRNEGRSNVTIVNILSVSALVGTPMRTMYCASKAALSGFGKSLRAEVSQYGIKVCQIYPAYVQTNIS